MKIEHRIATETLGEADEAYAAAYVSALTAELCAQYPGAEIDVNLNSDFCNACQTIVTGADDDDEVSENVRVVANLVWDRM